VTGRRFNEAGRTSTSAMRTSIVPINGRWARRVNGITVQPREPIGLGWRRVGNVRDPHGVELHGWLHLTTRTQVVTAVAVAEQPRSGTAGPQWHVSIVDRSMPEPLRPTSLQVALARCAFDMLEAEEDNHHPGNARHFWLPVDPTERVDCECKSTETTVEEADGYRWTNPTDGPCRGCEHERSMRAMGMERPCPLHRPAETPPSEDDAPYVCPGCHAVGDERCAPGCIDDEMRREHEDAITYGNYDDRYDENGDAISENELEMQDRFNAESDR
jgi:hypothetical protein